MSAVCVTSEMAAKEGITVPDHCCHTLDLQVQQLLCCVVQESQISIRSEVMRMAYIIDIKADCDKSECTQ